MGAYELTDDELRIAATKHAGFQQCGVDVEPVRGYLLRLQRKKLLEDIGKHSYPVLVKMAGQGLVKRKCVQPDYWQELLKDHGIER